MAGNADYVVDGLCRQLRHLDEHPRCAMPARLCTPLPQNLAASMRARGAERSRTSARNAGLDRRFAASEAGSAHAHSRIATWVHAPEKAIEASQRHAELCLKCRHLCQGALPVCGAAAPRGRGAGAAAAAGGARARGRARPGHHRAPQAPRAHRRLPGLAARDLRRRGRRRRRRCRCD